VLVSAFEFQGTRENSAVGVFSTHNLRIRALELIGLCARAFFVEDVAMQMIATAASSLMKILKQSLAFESSTYCHRSTFDSDASGQLFQ
jgi:hypothetical protein